jgi:Skp family chaperone for outer membrane proteins
MIHRRFAFLLVVALAVGPAGTLRAADEGMDIIDVTSITQAIDQGQKEAAAAKDQYNKQQIDALTKLRDDVAAANAASQVLSELESSKESPFSSDTTAIAFERSSSSLLTQSLRQKLDILNLQSVLGYSRVENVDSTTDINTYLQGRTNALALLYDTQIDLFCLEESKDSPAGCGNARTDFGVEGAENFIDFFLNDKTWPTRTVTDVMKLARGYFGFIPEKEDLSMIDEGGEFLAKQMQISKNNLKMSIMNYLASRRAPSSMATGNVLKLLLNGFAKSLTVSSLNYEDICDKQTKTDK